MNRLKYLFTFSLLVIILIFAWKLRFRYYDVIPLPGESQDEYSYSWVGLSLIRLGIPVGHTSLPGYQNTDYRYINIDHIYQNTARGLSLSLNRPWLDHPPLLGLITGGWSYLNGARVFADTTAHLIRQPMLAFSMATVILVFWLGSLIGGVFTGLIAAAIMAVSPIITVSSRMVQAENGFIVTWLVALVLLIYHLRLRHLWLLYTSAVIAGISVWFKFPGIISVASLTLILYLHRSYLTRFTWVRFLVTALLTALPVFIYGFSFGPIFITIQQSNSARPYGLGFDVLYKLITSSKITTDKFLTDGWIPAAWIAVFVSINRPSLNRRLQPIWISLLCYLFIYLYMGSGDYGWYHIPFFPFLSLILASYLVYTWQHTHHIFISCLLLLLPIGVSLGKLYGSVTTSGFLSLWKVLLLLVYAVFVLKFTSNRRWIVRSIFLIILAISFYTSLKYNLLITPPYWYHAT